MSYIALYRKWRPLVFQDVVEQEHVVKTLKNSVSSGRIAHAYLFCGTRGTGKTTMAHILSRAINCLNPKEGDPCNQCEICTAILSNTLLDVVEIDAASNNSVDNIREIRDEVIYTPSRAKYKVYIIDEVHMLSTGAFNALLKTLEEPPKHVVFILATTEPHKLPATVLSRCQRFDFRRITIESIMKRLDEIAVDNNIHLTKEASRLIARLSDGALRDAISLFDQCISLGKSEITYDLVMSVVGIAADTFLSNIVDILIDNDINKLLNYLDKLVLDGIDIGHFVSDLIRYYRNILVCIVSEKPNDIIDASSDSISIMKKQSKNYTLEEVSNIIKELSALENRLKWASYPRILLEVSLIKICEGLEYSQIQSDISGKGNIEDNGDSRHVLLKRIAILEKRIEDLNSRIAALSQSSLKSTTPIVEVSEQVTPIDIKKDIPTHVPASVPPKDADVPPESALENWNELLDKLASRGKMVLYTYLLGTKAVVMDKNVIGIIFPQDKSSLKDVISTQDNIQILEELLSKNIGREVRIKMLNEDFFEMKMEQQKQEKDEYVEKAQVLSKKLNVPLDKINLIDE
jgi:DNA polymerase-3 subunit gamma/tau